MSRVALERLKIQTARCGDKWHWVEEADQARIRCMTCGAAGIDRAAEVCHHAGNPHPFFYYCLAHGIDRGYTRSEEGS